MGLTNSLARAIEPLRRNLRQLVGKGSVDTVDDSKAMQVLQIVVGKDEVLDRVERVQPFGLTSVPRRNDELIYVCIGGEREHAVAISVDASRKRPKGLQEGEVCVYKDEDNTITFKANGDIEVNAQAKVTVTAGTQADVSAPTVRLGGLALETALGIVTGACSCSITGAPHAVTSQTAKATL